jgi:hypothetical protein
VAAREGACDVEERARALWADRFARRAFGSEAALPSQVELGLCEVGRSAGGCERLEVGVHAEVLEDGGGDALVGDEGQDAERVVAARAASDVVAEHAAK